MTAGRCTCPAQARAIVDELEAKVAPGVGELASAGAASEDRETDVPATPEPPD